MEKKKKELRKTISVSMTDSERDRLAQVAKSYGLSLSAFLRLAAKKFIDEETNEEVVSAVDGRMEIK